MFNISPPQAQGFGLSQWFGPNVGVPAYTTTFSSSTTLNHWKFDEHIAAQQLIYGQRLREMPSGNTHSRPSRSNKWVGLKPRRQPKAHPQLQGHQQPRLSAHHVFDDTSLAPSLGTAGYDGSFAVRLFTWFEHGSPPRTSFVPFCARFLAAS
jgi:hypothetical protein